MRLPSIRRSLYDLIAIFRVFRQQLHMTTEQPHDDEMGFRLCLRIEPLWEGRYELMDGDESFIRIR